MMLPARAARIWIRFVAFLYLLLGPAIALYGLYALWAGGETELPLYGVWRVNRYIYGLYHLGYGLFLLAVSVAFFKRYRPVWILFLIFSLPEHFTWLLTVQPPWNIVILLVELAAWTMTLMSAELFRG